MQAQGWPRRQGSLSRARAPINYQESESQFGSSHFPRARAGLRLRSVSSPHSPTPASGVRTADSAHHTRHTHATCLLPLARQRAECERTGAGPPDAGARRRSAEADGDGARAAGPGR